MTIKKKLGLGVASAVLGLSLIGGGTFAAFNDTATVNNHFASGTLELSVGNEKNEPVNFDISNMKPGDTVKREFKLRNNGTLPIKNVFLTFDAEEYSNHNSGATMDEFLSQFHVDFFKVDHNNNDQYDDYNSLIKAKKVVTLNDLVKGTLEEKIKDRYLAAGKMNLAPIGIDNNPKGLNKSNSHSVSMIVTFKEDHTKNDDGEYKQNKFMNNKINLKFNFEASQ